MIKLFFSKSNSIACKCIRFFTWSEYSHVGFILPDDMILDTTLKTKVAIRPFKDLEKTEKTIIIREYQDINENVIEIAKAQIGKKYDWSAVVGIPFRRNWQDDDKWFCSELVAWSCLKAETPIINKDCWRITPQDLFQIL
jgi:uncharacterized protein YycO